jgi:hypothetical protein
MPGIIELYGRYYSDGMIGADIVDLLKLWARIPKNTAFTYLFLLPLASSLETNLSSLLRAIGPLP